MSPASSAVTMPRTGSHTAPAATPLRRLISRLREQHAGKVVTLIDLSAIPNIQSRIMFRSMARFIEERTIDIPVDAIPLARNVLILAATPAVALKIRHRLDALSADLQDQRHGSLVVRQFDLYSQAEAFAETAHRLMEQAPLPHPARLFPLRDEAPPDLDSLNRVIDVHQILWHADLTNYSRRQSIWRLRPDVAPTVLADEIWVSIRALEQSTGIALDDNVWLLGKATELLDQRTIARIATENASLTRPISLNLHLSTIVSTAFQTLIADKPAAQIHNLMAEVPLVEWRTNRPLGAAALKTLRQHGIRFCLDNIRPEDVASLTESEWQADYLKFNAEAGMLRQQVAALQALPPVHRAVLQEKGIFCHCDDSNAVAAGIGLVQHFQGRGLKPMLEDIETTERLFGRKTADCAAVALKGF